MKVDETRLVKGKSGNTLITVTFKDVAGGTEMRIVHERFATAAGRDGHDFGWKDSFNKLERRIAR